MRFYFFTVAALFIVVITMMFLSVHSAQAYQSPGKPTGYVNDFAEVLSSDQHIAIEKELSNFEKATTNEISVVTIPTLDESPIEDYTNVLFREWGIGKEDKNNGILFLIAVDDHIMRIEVGYGLEGNVTDIATKHLQDDIARPAFRNGDYAGGIIGVVSGLVHLVEPEYVVTSMPSSAMSSQTVQGERGGIDIFNILFIVIWIISLGVPLFAGIIKKGAQSKAWWHGGIAGGILGIIFIVIWSAWIALLISIGTGLIIDFILSILYEKNIRFKKRIDALNTRRGGSGGGMFFLGGSGLSGGSSRSSFGGFGGGSSGGG